MGGKGSNRFFKCHPETAAGLNKILKWSPENTGTKKMLFIGLFKVLLKLLAFSLSLNIYLICEHVIKMGL